MPYILKISLQLHGYLMEQLGMPEPLLQSLITWADIQSLLQRSSELEVTFKAQLARQMHAAAISLYRFTIGNVILFSL